MEPSPETTPGRHPAGAAAATQPLGEPLALSSKALNAGSAALETFAPLKLRVCQHVCAFHAYANDSTRLVHAHHFYLLAPQRRGKGDGSSSAALVLSAPLTTWDDS